MTNRNPYGHPADRRIEEQFRKESEDHRSPRFVIVSLIAILMAATSSVASLLMLGIALGQAQWLVFCVPYFVVTIGFCLRARLPSPSRSTRWVWPTSIVVQIVMLVAWILDQWPFGESQIGWTMVWLGLWLVSILFCLTGFLVDRKIMRDRLSHLDQ